MNKNDTAIIFGRSPFINVVKEFIPELIRKFPFCIGCNSFFQNYPEVPYSAFIDSNQAKLFIDYSGTILTPKSNIESLRYFPNKKKTFFIDKFEEEELWRKDEHAFRLYDTPSFIMSLAIKKGLKNIILIGVDYNPNNKGHFNDDKNMTWIEDKKFLESREFVENKINQYINVYVTNPDSIIRVPFINVKDLLKEI